MAQYEQIVRLKVEEEDALAALGKLQLAIKADAKELKALTAEAAKNGDQSVETAKQVGLLTAKIENSRVQVREMKNDLSGATAAGLRFRDKMADAFSERLNASFMNLGAAIAAAFSIDKLADFVMEMRDLGITIEQTEARARVLLGGAFDDIAASATDAGEAIGLSKNEYVGLVTVAQDVFTNLGLTAEATADLSQQIVATAGGIEDFTAGQTSAAQATEILKNAVLGNTKGLKELNINVKDNQEEIDAMAQELVKSEGVTLQQAEALARLQFTFEAVNPKIAEFSQYASDADLASDRATASWKNAKEELARGLQPALTAITSTLADVVSGFNELFLAQGDVTGARGAKSGKAAQAENDAKAYLEAVNTYVKANEQLAAGDDTLAMAQRQQALVRSQIERAKGLEDLIRIQGFYTRKLQEAEPASAAYGMAMVNLKLVNEELAKVKNEQAKPLETEIQNTAILTGEVAKQTEKVVELTAAERERLALQKEMAALAAQAPAALDPLAAPSVNTPISQGVPLTDNSGFQKASEERIKILTAEKDAFEELELAKIDAAQGLSDALASLAEDGSSVQKVFLAISKAAAIAEVIVKTQAEIAGYFATYSGVPGGPAIAATLSAAAKLRAGVSIATIAATAIKGFAEGGVVSGTRIEPRHGTPISRSNGDNLLATVKTGEVILNEEQQQRLRSRAGWSIFSDIGVPGFATGGGTVRGTALVNASAPTLPTSGAILASEQLVATRAMAEAQIVLPVESYRAVDRLVTVRENRSTL